MGISWLVQKVTNQSVRDLGSACLIKPFYDNFLVREKCSKPKDLEEGIDKLSIFDCCINSSKIWWISQHNFSSISVPTGTHDGYHPEGDQRWRKRRGGGLIKGTGGHSEGAGSHDNAEEVIWLRRDRQLWRQQPPSPQPLQDMALGHGHGLWTQLGP